MRTQVVDHPLVAHKLTVLRDQDTASPTFRLLADELVTLLAYEATREVRVEPYDIVTPVAPTTGTRLASPKPLVVPILRAGLGMLDGMMRLLPTAEVGFLGMVRNEETLEASTYAERLPEDLSGRQCYVLDPMLATGGTLVAAIEFLTARGADDITVICLLTAPEGMRPARGGPRRPRRPGHRRHRRDGRAAQRARLHRPRPRRRRRPAVRRRRLSVAQVFSSNVRRASPPARPRSARGPTWVTRATSGVAAHRGGRSPAPRGAGGRVDLRPGGRRPAPAPRRRPPGRRRRRAGAPTS